jgi:hypothetical protein
VIYGKVGTLGQGKTMRAVVDALALQELRGRRRECWLASNVKINAPAGVRFDHLPVDGFSETLAALLLEARTSDAGLVVVVDEVDEIWGASDWQNMRKGDRHRIKQSRHYGADLIVTAQFVDQIEKSIRNIMSEVELMRAYPSPTLARFEAGKRPWLLRGQRFRPAAVRELVGEPEKEKRLGSSWYRYRREHEALYDTNELIEPVNAEQLCAKHARELKEDRCPMCHPELYRKPLDARPIRDLVVMAASTPADAENGHSGEPTGP